jgi:hypothetical protein
MFPNSRYVFLHDSRRLFIKLRGVPLLLGWRFRRESARAFHARSIMAWRPATVADRFRAEDRLARGQSTSPSTNPRDVLKHATLRRDAGSICKVRARLALSFFPGAGLFGGVPREN